MAKGKTTKSGAQRLNRSMEPMTRFWQNPLKKKPRSDRDVLNQLQSAGYEQVEKKLRKIPEAASERIFGEVGLPAVAKTICNRILGNLDSIKSIE